MSTTPISTRNATERLGPERRDPPPLWTTLRDLAKRPESRAPLLGALAAVGLLLLIFRSNVVYLPYVWWTDPNYGHGFLVPLISLYFANIAAARGPVRYEPALSLGSGLIALSILGRLATIVVPVGIVGDLSMLTGLFGICVLFAGRAAAQRYAFAIGFLVFMVPLPIHLYTTIASPLQLLVSRTASEILNASGLPVLCEGNRLTLPGDVTLFVAEACSGMRQLTGFLALTTAVAYLSARPLWYRAVLITSAVPVALTANIARVVLTGWIMNHDPSLAQGTFHTLEGLLLMGFGLGLLRIECAALNLLLITPSKSSKAVQAEGSGS